MHIKQVEGNRGFGFCPQHQGVRGTLPKVLPGSGALTTGRLSGTLGRAGWVVSGCSACLFSGKLISSGGPSCADDSHLMSFPSYVANDMEEDNQAPKQAIFSFLYGKNRSQRPLFHKLRLQFIRSMGWNARVTREECEQVGGLWRSGGGAGPERRWGSWGIRSRTWGRTRKNRTRGTGRQRHPHFQGLFVFPDPGF